MHKKYFFFDIDGTLTDKKTNKVVPSALKALKKLQDNGHFVAIATGRAHYKAINFMREIGLKNMVCNGGHGLVVNEQLVKNAPLDFQKCLAVIEQANQLGYGVLVAPYDNNEVYGKDFLFLKQAGFRKEPSTYYFDSNYDFSKFNDIYKMYGSSGIPCPEGEIIMLSPEEEDIFDQVYDAYGQFSALKLMEMTHSEEPWKSTPVGIGNVISKEKIKKYFLTQIES